MKRYLQLLFIFALFVSVLPQQSKAQSIKLVGQNTLNGAINGVLLGGATMALQDNDKFGPIRVGLGSGTLYGIGVGIHDVSLIDKGQQFYLSGTFNDATNSSVIPLLDTIYGAAGGALIASSVALIIKEPLTDALQYGSGIGAWAGFGFGLVDAFFLAEGPDFSQASTPSPSNVDGFITYENASRSVEIGMISPSMVKQTTVSANALSTSWTPSLTVMNVSVNL
ncbi:hypothetical protein SAMN05443144_1025 [Fodinibius roseus]|uniref:Outer membrane protein beta-barrel domain-containing protein n=1 Tax=Fodinibius roseus TaxID=1194090 RepID=A0A1M4UE63_9BACT|nr:hypothetical protein [Fodinibius roseus]SHE54860.1 hypothetical protein SAMN05443144_1025 [Fodinibius roseus]